MGRQRGQAAVVVALHRLDGGDPGEVRQGGQAVDVPRVQDQVDPFQNLEQPVWQAVDELGAVSVRHHPDPGHRHSLAGLEDAHFELRLDKLARYGF